MSFTAMRKRLYHTRNRVGAIEGAFCAANYLDFIDVVEREVGKIKRATGKIYGGAVDQHIGLIGIAAVQEDTGEAAFRTGAVDGDTRRVYQDVGEGNGLALLDFVPSNDRDGGGSFLLQCGFRLRGDYHASGEALELKVQIESARLCRGKIQNQITRHERFARETKVVSAGRNVERVRAIVCRACRERLGVRRLVGLGSDADAGNSRPAGIH